MIDDPYQHVSHDMHHRRLQPASRHHTMPMPMPMAAPAGHRAAARRRVSTPLKFLVTLVSVAKLVPLIAAATVIIVVGVMASEIGFAEGGVGEEFEALAGLVAFALILVGLVIVFAGALVFWQLIAALRGRVTSLIVAATVMSFIDVVAVAVSVLGVDDPTDVGAVLNDVWLIVAVAAAQLAVLGMAIKARSNLPAGPHRSA